MHKTTHTNNLVKDRTMMMRYLIVLVFIAVTMSAPVHSALIKSYDFDGDYTDTLGNGDNLVASGGSISFGMYNFDLNQGLRLNNALGDTSNYAIEMRLRVNDSLGGYNKLIDFQDLSSDIGLYLQNGAALFYTAANFGGGVTLGEYFTLALVRSSNDITAYLNGSSLGTFSDSGSQAVSVGNSLNFFEDDNRTSQSEAFDGSVDFIRIHADSSTLGQAPVGVPEPATLGLFGLMLLAMRRFIKH